jgi:DNA helicase-2/ATP-dependent DNA helicase PcrA
MAGRLCGEGQGALTRQGRRVRLAGHNEQGTGVCGTVSTGRRWADELNERQLEAVTAPLGPALVLAGPGSGKTRVLTYRIAYLVSELHVPPRDILAVTFTNKAAGEMTNRLRQLVGPLAAQLTVGTFHAICVRILRREAPHVGFGADFTIYDADDQDRVITRLVKELDLDSKQYRPSAIANAISRAKNELITPATYAPPTYWHEAVARVFARYEEFKHENNALDFDDLLQKAEELLREHADVRARYQRRWRQVLVDEFQDTNRAQYDLVLHLASEHRQAFVVGDEDQSIYSWRGADYRNVQRFRADFGEARVVLLERNYRSTQNILDAAQGVISRNQHRIKKTLWTEAAAGAPIQLFEAYDEREEAAYVVTELRKLISNREVTAGECAVMFRTNAQSRALEDAFMQHNITYRLVGAVRFYQRREIKDVLCYLRLIHNIDDEVSLRRIINVPARKIGERTVEQLQAHARARGLSMGRALLELADARSPREIAQGGALSTGAANSLQSFAQLLAGLGAAREALTLPQLLERLLHDSGYLGYLRDGTEEGEERISNVRELFTAVERYSALPPEDALRSFLEDAALVSDTDEADWQQDAVTMLTLHSAKGLEFDTVFMVGMEEGICPHVRSLEDPEQMEEERRLCYVGVTRAKQRLYLVRAFRRTLYGSAEVRDPSRFLADIPRGVLAGGPQVAGPRAGGQALGRPSAPSSPDGNGARGAGLPAAGLWVQRRREQSEAVRRRRVELAAHDDERRTARAAVPAPAPARPAPARHEAAFGPGDVVRHPLFGEGTVVSSRVVGSDEEVTVAFAEQGVKRLLAQYARLEKVSAR